MTYNELIESILTAQEQMLKLGIEANSVTLNGRKFGRLIENLPPNIKPTIFGMAVKADYALPDDYDFLVQYEPPHPQTNADRIRSMTDEELAKKIVRLVVDAFDQVVPEWKRKSDRDNRIAGTENDVLNWLKREVTDG